MLAALRKSAEKTTWSTPVKVHGNEAPVVQSTCSGCRGDLRRASVPGTAFRQGWPFC